LDDQCGVCGCLLTSDYVDHVGHEQLSSDDACIAHLKSQLADARLCAEVVRVQGADAIEYAWGIIANAFGGNWEQATPEWRQAAEVWRDRYITPRSA